MVQTYKFKINSEEDKLMNSYINQFLKENNIKPSIQEDYVRIGGGMFLYKKIWKFYEIPEGPVIRVLEREPYGKPGDRLENLFNEYSVLGGDNSNFKKEFNERAKQISSKKTTLNKIVSA